MVVSIDEPVYGKHWSNLSAVPSSREIIKRMLIKYDEIHKNIVKTPSTSKEENVQNHELSLSNYSRIDKDAFPDFRGKTLKEALKIANEMDITLIPDGISGKIINQSIDPGSVIADKMTCQIKIEI